MPELPEIETTRRGIAPHIVGHRVQNVVVREARLRWPVGKDLPTRLVGQAVSTVGRRGKYLLIGMETGTLLVHLGMSGSLRICPAESPARRHDHIDVVFDQGKCLRLHDPRRFGCLLWTTDPPEHHPLLAGLGPEPLGSGFGGGYLYRLAAGRRSPVKPFLMDSRVVVGVGNIYANEALFRAGIHPRRAAGRIGLVRYQRLAACITEVLLEAIRQGGTTLRDFVNESGSPGYFQQTLRVYGRAGEPCMECGKPIRLIRVGQRSTYYCGGCQR